MKCMAEDISQADINGLKVIMATLVERVDQGFQHLNSEVKEIKTNHLVHLSLDIKDLQTKIATLSIDQNAAVNKTQTLDLKLAIVISILSGLAFMVLNIIGTVIIKLVFPN